MRVEQRGGRVSSALSFSFIIFHVYFPVSLLFASWDGSERRNADSDIYSVLAPRFFDVSCKGRIVLCTAHYSKACVEMLLRACFVPVAVCMAKESCFIWRAESLNIGDKLCVFIFDTRIFSYDMLR